MVGVDGDIFTVYQHQHTFQTNFFTGIDRQAIDLKSLAFDGFVLLAAAFNNRVSHFFSWHFTSPH
jgi:hypothetical protein